jgi:IS30 family transposase
LVATDDSTVHREIGRNRVHLPVDLHYRRYDNYGSFKGYFPLTAQDLAGERRRRLGKRRRDPSLRGHVVARLEAGWSPQQIAGWLKRYGLVAGPLT